MAISFFRRSLTGTAITAALLSAGLFVSLAITTPASAESCPLFRSGISPFSCGADSHGYICGVQPNLGCYATDAPYDKSAFWPWSSGAAEWPLVQPTNEQFRCSNCRFDCSGGTVRCANAGPTNGTCQARTTPSCAPGQTVSYSPDPCQGVCQGVGYLVAGPGENATDAVWPGGAAPDKSITGNVVWDGKEIAVSKGGTGLTTAGADGQVLATKADGSLEWKSASAADPNPVFASVTAPLFQNPGALTVQTSATTGADDLIFKSAGNVALQLYETGGVGIFGPAGLTGNLLRGDAPPTAGKLLLPQSSVAI